MTGTRSDGQTGTSRRPDSAGQEVEAVAGYRDLTRIGHGGFSVVYRAVQESFERSVALKVLSVGPGEDAQGRFLREVRLAGRLSGHPHVVTVLDAGTTRSGRPYLAMDLYDGGSMKQRLARSGPLSPGETAVVGAKVAEALAAAHALGVLHRDVKPNNILISKFGEPALADFGVSCLLDSSSSASVLDVFSPQHAAPELMTRGVPSASSDVYALGSTLYELVTGRPPFDAEGRDVRSVIWRALSEPAPRPECPGLPALADAIVRAMAKEPEDRFADAAEFAQTLRALIPEGAPATLVMPAETESAHASDGSTRARDAAAAAVAAEGGAAPGDEAGGEPDAASYGRAYAADETRVRPDRIEAGAAAVSGKSGKAAKTGKAPKPAKPGGALEGGLAAEGGEERGTAERLRKPLAAASAVILLGAVGWIVFASQGPSPNTTDDAAAHKPSASPSASPSRTPSHARPTPGATPTKHVTAPAEPASAKSSISSAPADATSAAAPTSSSGSLLGLIGDYYRFQNRQSGDCLAQSSGSSPSALACAASESEGWEYSVPLTGLLSAGSGQFELLNQASGDCLTTGSGSAVSVQSCDGGSAQLWSKAATTGSGTELQNVGDGQCLQASGGEVTAGSCGAGDPADLWNEDGTS